MNEQLLKKHIEAAPRMAPTDAVKLAFQSAFGCGHLLSARESCAEYVRREMAQVQEDPSVPSAVLIGRGLCRLNLAAPQVRSLPPETIADMMLLTNDQVLARQDNQTVFEQTLSQLEQLAEGNQLPFSAAELAEYLTLYRAQGCPPVSHSEGYREAYHPAYRVVLSDFALLLPVLNRGADVVVLDGMCGSGKSTLASLLAALLDTQPIPMDDFFLPFDMRTQERLRQPGGNVHYERFAQEVLTKLLCGRPVAWNRFDCSTGALIPRSVPSGRAVIIEGSYSHHPFFRQAYEQLHALRVFVRTEDEEQLHRIALRNPDLLSRFQSTWIPLEKNYFEAYDMEGTADVVLSSQRWEADGLFLKEDSV